MSASAKTQPAPVRAPADLARPAPAPDRQQACPQDAFAMAGLAG
jgi:hypothetical protein